MKLFPLGFTFLAALAIVPPASAQPLVKAIDIRALSATQAREELPVALRAAVTFVEPGTVYLQDETAGTFLRVTGPSGLRPGDEIELTGRTRSGLYLPGVTLDSFRIVRRGSLPNATLASYDDLVSGRFHYQRVAVEGIVRLLAPLEEDRSSLRIAVGSRVVEARMETTSERETSLIGAKVRVAGLVAGIINDRRQLVQPYLRVGDWSDVVVVNPAARDEDVQAISAAKLLAFDVTGQAGQRVRIQGTVTAAFRDGWIFLTNEGTAFGVKLVTPRMFEVGDEIEVLGFPEMGRVSAYVADGVAIHRGRGAMPSPLELDDVTQLRSGHDGSLVAVTGVVTDSFRTDGGVTLVLQSGTRTLQARVPPPGIEVEVGMLVRLVGICQVESAKPTPTYNTEIDAVTLRVRAASDIAVLRSPTWWTPRRLAATLAVLAAAVVLSALWITGLRRQVSRQTKALRSRIESEAALEERHRIAREFHDSLEQELAGLRLRLDALATRTIDGKGREIVEASRGLLARIQVETHSLICDLRDSTATAGDLPAALRTVVESHVASDSGATQVKAEIAPGFPALPESTVHHLRMIARETLNNARKHAAAMNILLTLHVEDDDLIMRIVDDGRGFDSTVATRGKPGHFGCVGIRERADRLGGVVAWHSSHAQGTRFELRLPLSHRHSAAANRALAENAATTPTAN